MVPLPLPERVVLFVPLGADGAGCLTVRDGDSVATGQALTSAEPPVVSPVTGRVSGLREIVWTAGESFSVVEVETARVDTWAPGGPGPALPTSGTVIINGLESDLQITVNRQVILDAAEDLRTGVALLGEVGVKTILVAVPQDLIGPLGPIPGATVVAIPAVHPNGHPEVLARRVGRIHPLSGRVEVISAEALASAARTAAGEHAPEKLVTFTGPSGCPERVFKVRIGTPVGDLLDAAGVPAPTGGRVLLGGPLTGRAAFGLDFPIMGDIDAVILQGPEQTGNVPFSQCINCGKCVEICPNKLPVNLLSRYAEHSLFEKAEELDAERCIECGLCAFVCVSQRPIVQFIQHAKNEIRTRREAL